MRKREIENKNKGNKIIAVLLCGTLIAGVIGVTSAYFTDHHSVMNEFTVGEVKTELKEPKWDETGKKDAGELRPNMTIVKDPVITNTGVSDSYNFISFRIPYKKFAALGTFGTKTINGITVEGQCLDDFDMNAVNGVDVTAKDLFSHSISEGWILVESTQNEAGGYHEYTYAYASGENATTGTMTALKNGNSTSAFFKDEKIRAINLVEDEWALQQDGVTGTEKQHFNIPVRSYSIQTSDIAGTDGKGKHDPESVWKVVKAQVNAKYTGMAENSWGNTIGINDGKGNDGIYGSRETAGLKAE